MRFIYTKTFLAFAISLLLVAVLVFLDSRGLIDSVRKAVLQAPRPVVYLTEKLTVPVKNFFSAVYTLKNINSENAKLEFQVAELRKDLVMMNQYKLENEILKKEIGFVKTSQLKLQPCTVLSSDPAGISDTLVLSCGSDDSVKPGQAVVSQGYLIGRITLVKGSSSTVLLITNAKSVVDGKISRTGAEGVVKGSFSSGLVFELASQNTDIRKDDLVVTAGINNLIPKGLIIGEIGDSLSADNELFKRNSIVSPVRFYNLDFVFVVK